MAEIQSTRLRFIKAKSINDLVEAVDSLPFKVEIKGNPVKDAKAWVIFFVIPEMTNLKFESVDLT